MLKLSFKSGSFQSRIKKMMQSDEDVGKVAAASTILVARALESFLNMLLDGAVEIASSRNARTLTSSHLKACVAANPLLDFCKDATASAPDLPPAGEAEPSPQRAKRGRPASGESTRQVARKQSRGRGRGRGAGGRGEDASGTSQEEEHEVEEGAAMEAQAEAQAEGDEDNAALEAAADAGIPASFIDAAPGREAEEEDYDE